MTLFDLVLRRDDLLGELYSILVRLGDLVRLGFTPIQGNEPFDFCKERIKAYEEVVDFIDDETVGEILAEAKFLIDQLSFVDSAFICLKPQERLVMDALLKKNKTWIELEQELLLGKSSIGRLRKSAQRRIECNTALSKMWEQFMSRAGRNLFE